MYKVSYNADNMASDTTIEGTMGRALLEIGLSDHEACVYAALLEESPSGAARIAKRVGLSRSSVYTTLGVLIARGLVGEVRTNDVKQFSVEGSGALRVMLSDEARELEKKNAALAGLEKKLTELSRGTTQLPRMTYFEGAAGLKKIYLAMMRDAPKGAVRLFLRDEFVWRKEWEFIFKDDWRGTIQRWKKEKSLKTKLLVNPSLLEKSKRKFYSEQKDLAVRYLSREASVADFALYIVGESVAVMSFQKNDMSGVHIVHANMAQNFTKIFEGMWKGAVR